MKISLILLLVSLVSCQMSRHSGNSNRQIASTSQFKAAINELKTLVGKSDDELEVLIKEYIKDETAQNYKAIGLTKEQAENIDSLADGFSYMPKVRKHILENMDNIFPSADKQKLSQIYSSHVLSDGSGLNPYAYVQSAASLRQQSRNMSPSFKLEQKESDLLDKIESVSDQETKQELKESMIALKSRSDIGEPEVLANGLEIIEAATAVSLKAGQKGLSGGCKTFIKEAPLEILASKADVDIYRATLVAERSPSSIQEIDEITEMALVKVMDISPDQAKQYLKNLKNPPCEVY